MSDLARNAFIGSKEKPTEAALAAALGATKPVWDGLLEELAATHGVDIQEWKSYSPKAGWALRMMRGKRTIVWISPCEGSFFVSVILGQKAITAARQSALSAKLARILDEAPKYPEGTGVRLEIKGPRDLAAVRKLVAVKIAN